MVKSVKKGAKKAKLTTGGVERGFIPLLPLLGVLLVFGLFFSVLKPAISFQGEYSSLEPFKANIEQKVVAKNSKAAKSRSAKMELLDNQISSRHFYMIAVAILSLTMIFSIIISATSIFLSARDNQRLKQGVSLIAILSMALPVFVYFIVRKNELFSPRVILDFIDIIMHTTEINIVHIALVLNGSAIATVFFLAVAFTCALFTPAANNKTTLQLLRKQGFRVRVLLYTGAVLLMTAVAAEVSVYNWPSSFGIWSEAELGHLRNITSTLAVTSGTFYSLLLLGMYAPSAVFIRLRAFEISNMISPSSTAQQHKEELEKLGLASSGLEQIKNVGIILAPIIASFLGGPLAKIF